MTIADLSPALRWRSVGPSRGGRSVAVTGHPESPAVAYFGACAGGDRGCPGSRVAAGVLAGSRSWTSRRRCFPVSAFGTS